MDEERGVEELEGRCGVPERGRTVFGSTERAESCHDQRRSKPLAVVGRCGQRGGQRLCRLAVSRSAARYASDAPADGGIDLDAIGGRECDHEALRRALPEKSSSCSAWSTSHGLKAQGVASSPSPSASGSTQRASATSRGLSSGSSSVIAR